MSSNSQEVTSSVSNEVSQSGVCPLPSFLPSRLSDNMVTSTQKEQSNTPITESWRSEANNYSCDTEPLHNTTSTETSTQPCSTSDVKHSLGMETFEGVKENLLAIRHIFLKLLALPDNKSIMKRLGYLSDVQEAIIFFIKFSSRFDLNQETADSQFSKTDSDYLGDVSNLSSLYLNHLMCGFKKRHQKVVDLEPAVLDFESNAFSQGDSFESGNYVYAPKIDNLYGPAEVQNASVTSTSRDKEMCGVKFLRTDSPGREAVTEEDVISINCRDIYNHERLPVNANVLVKDLSSGSEETSVAFRRAIIVEAFEKKSRSKQASYAYKVQFLDNREYKRVNHEQVLIEREELQRLSRTKKCISQLSKEVDEPSPTRSMSEYMTQLSLESKSKSVPCPPLYRAHPTQPCKETSSLFTLDETSTRTSLKRQITEQCISSLSSGQEAGPSAAKKQEKDKMFSGIHFIVTGFKAQKADNSENMQSITQGESFGGESVRERRDSNELEGSAAELAMRVPRDESSQKSEDDENGNQNEMDEAQLKQIIESNGGKICETVEKMRTFSNPNEVFLLAPRPLTSPKFLGALALDIPCLNGSAFISHCVAKKEPLSSTKDDFISAFRLHAGRRFDPDEWVEWKQCEQLSLRRKYSRKDLFAQRKIYLPLCSESAHLSTVLTFTKAEVVLLNIQRCSIRSSGINENSYQNSFAVIGQNFRFSSDVHKLLTKYSVPILKARYISQCLILGKELPFLEYLVD